MYLIFLVFVVICGNKDLCSLNNLLLIKEQISPTSGRISLRQGCAPYLAIQCSVVSPETIYTQPIQTDSASFIHIFEHTFSHILDKEEIDWEELGERWRTEKGKVMQYILSNVYKNKR